MAAAQVPLMPLDMATYRISRPALISGSKAWVNWEKLIMEVFIGPVCRRES